MEPLLCITTQWFIGAGQEAAYSLLKEKKGKETRLLAFLKWEGKSLVQHLNVLNKQVEETPFQMPAHGRHYFCSMGGCSNVMG